MDEDQDDKGVESLKKWSQALDEVFSSSFDYERRKITVSYLNTIRQVYRTGQLNTEMLIAICNDDVQPSSAAVRLCMRRWCA